MNQYYVNKIFFEDEYDLVFLIEKYCGFEYFLVLFLELLQFIKIVVKIYNVKFKIFMKLRGLV